MSRPKEPRFRLEWMRAKEANLIIAEGRFADVWETFQRIIAAAPSLPLDVPMVLRQLDKDNKRIAFFAFGWCDGGKPELPLIALRETNEEVLA